MPNIPSAKKALRQNVKQHARNQANKSQMRTRIKKALTAIRVKDVEKATLQLREAESVIDKNARRGLLHPNAAARRKSRMTRKLNALKAAE